MIPEVKTRAVIWINSSVKKNVYARSEDGLWTSFIRLIWPRPVSSIPGSTIVFDVSFVCKFLDFSNISSFLLTKLLLRWYQNKFIPSVSTLYYKNRAALKLLRAVCKQFLKLEPQMKKKFFNLPLHTQINFKFLLQFQNYLLLFLFYLQKL